MTQFRVEVSPDRRWDSDFQKSLHEALPYHVPRFVDARFDEAGVEIEAGIEPGAVDETRAAVETLITGLAASFRNIKTKVVRAQEARATPAATDPYEALVAARAVTPTGRGKFVYSGEFVTVFQALDALIVDLARTFGAAAELYPTTVQTRTLLDSGYLGLHPQFAFFVAPAHLDSQSLVEINDPRILDLDNREETARHLSTPDQILAPTVCYHTFEARRGLAQGPHSITALNKCHRHEPVNVASLSRLTTYWMREIVTFGPAADVAAMLEETSRWTCDFIESLGLGYELVTASDPFFADRGASSRFMQSVFDLKREVKMPLFGGRSTAIASFNNHQASLVGKFGIEAGQDVDGALVSGCTGWGYERFIYALFCGLGESLDRWPAEAKKRLGI